MRIRTWVKEAFVVALALVAVVIADDSKPIEWVGSAAVLFTFMHAQVSFRLAEAEEKRSERSVECHRWMRRYFIMKEMLWLTYFVVLHAYSALVGVAVFLIYPLWRQWHLRRRVSRLRLGARVIVSKPLDTTPHRVFKGRTGTIVGPSQKDPDGWWVKLDGDPIEHLFFGFFELEHYGG